MRSTMNPKPPAKQDEGDVSKTKQTFVDIYCRNECLPEPSSPDFSNPHLSRGWFTRGYLPHHDDNSKIQHVSVHLADSLPASAVEAIELSIARLPESRRKTERRKRLHALVHAGHGSCILKVPTLAARMEECLLHFDGNRYDVHAWVIMPNHFHVLFQTKEGWAINKILSSWKKYSARRIKDYVRNHRETNVTLQAFDLNEAVWHPEYWDRFIRDESHYAQVIHYIHQNPVVSGLVMEPANWTWSSARYLQAEGKDEAEAETEA